MALTREPSARRASTIGDDSSMRRPTWLDDALDDPAQVRPRRHEAGLGALEPAAALHVDRLVGPLTMISVTVASARNRSMGPWPSTSSLISATRRCRSEADSGATLRLHEVADLLHHVGPELVLAEGGVEQTHAQPGEQRLVGALLHRGERIDDDPLLRGDGEQSGRRRSAPARARRTSGEGLFVA